jgi:hypothetical protein
LECKRTTQDSLSFERKHRLEEIGFVWNAFDGFWEEGFSKLANFKLVEGHCRVPASFKLDDFRLGGWVRSQRKAKGSMSLGRIHRLEDIGFIWDPFEEDWEQGFSKLHQFKEAEGHCRVKFNCKLDDFKLGSWVLQQRNSSETMSSARKQRLVDLGFVWDPLTETWEQGFNKLVQFKETEGHCRVPKRFVLDGFNLGNWTIVQKRNQSTMYPDRKQRLDEIGFIWAVSKDKT